MGIGRALVAGVAGGAAGAALMIPLFEGAKRAGLLREAPPVRVVDRAAEEAGVSDEVEPEKRTAAAAGSHLAYGAAAGAVYGAAQEGLGLPAAAGGVAFGLLLWAAGYLGWLPAAGVLPVPWRQRPGDALTPLVAHVVYGLTLGLVERAVRRR